MYWPPTNELHVESANTYCGIVDCSTDAQHANVATHYNTLHHLPNHQSRPSLFHQSKQATKQPSKEGTIYNLLA
jgi:hypothetical protein